MIAALKGAGVAAKDIQTARVSLSPRYSANGEDIVGYTASNTVNATIKGIARRRRDRSTPPWMPARTRCTGRRSRVSDEAALYSRALRAAVADARAKALALAAAAQRQARRRCARSSRRRPAPVPIAEKAAAGATRRSKPGTQQIEASRDRGVRASLGRAESSAARSDATYARSASGPCPRRPRPPASRRRCRRRARRPPRACSGVEMPKPA